MAGTISARDVVEQSIKEMKEPGDRVYEALMQHHK